VSIYKDRATGRWLFDFDRYIEGDRVRRRKLLPAGWTRAQADAFDRQEGAALYALATGVAKPRHYIDEAVARYLRERVPDLKAGDGAARELEQMRDWWTGRPLEQLPDVCREYAADQVGALKPATVRNRIAYLRAACRWAWKRGGMGDSDPGARVVVPSVNNARQVTVTRGQMVALAACPCERGTRALIRVLFYSGLRVSEAQRAHRVGGHYVLGDTKNGTPRIVPIHGKALAASRVPMPERGTIDYYWPLAREACGLEHVTLHDLRHTAASAMVNAGVDLATVGRVLGHKSAASTRRYTHWATETLAAAVGKIGRKVPQRGGA
jgi:integrase